MTPRYKLRTLLLLLAILPPLLAVAWWKYSAWRTRQRLVELEACVRVLAPIVSAERNFDLSGQPLPAASR